MELFNLIGLDIGYVVIGMAAVIILLFILLIVSMVKATMYVSDITNL